MLWYNNNTVTATTTVITPKQKIQKEKYTERKRERIGACEGETVERERGRACSSFVFQNEQTQMQKKSLNERCLRTVWSFSVISIYSVSLCPCPCDAHSGRKGTERSLWRLKHRSVTRPLILSFASPRFVSFPFVSFARSFARARVIISRIKRNVARHSRKHAAALTGGIIPRLFRFDSEENCRARVAFCCLLTRGPLDAQRKNTRQRVAKNIETSFGSRYEGTCHEQVRISIGKVPSVRLHFLERGACDVERLRSQGDEREKIMVDRVG